MPASFGAPSSSLPSPPPGERGWPWSAPPVEAAPRPPGGGPWPRITIVTPSYNQAPFLEATIRSVLLQGYPNLEYVVIDGGSTDGSVEVIRRYAPWLAYWASEPDGGQSDAINKGFARATGEVLGWLNSDDLYEPGTLEFVARFLASRPECELVYGNGWYVDGRGRKTHRCDWVRSFSRRRLLTVNFILQPAAFWRRRLWERTGPLDVACHWTMDWDWLIRATASTSPEYVERDLACWRIGAHVKTVTGGARRRAEIARTCRRHGGVWQPTYLAYQLDRLDKALRPRLGGGPAGRVYRAIVGPMRAGVRRLWGGRYLSDA